MLRDAAFAARVMAVMPCRRGHKLDCCLRPSLVSPQCDAFFRKLALRSHQRSSDQRHLVFATGEPRFARFAHA
jgi:hypothetical protein